MNITLREIVTKSEYDTDIKLLLSWNKDNCERIQYEVSLKSNWDYDIEPSDEKGVFSRLTENEKLQITVFINQIMNELN